MKAWILVLPGQWNFENSLTFFILALLVIACLQTLILVESLFTEKKQELTKERVNTLQRKKSEKNLKFENKSK